MRRGLLALGAFPNPVIALWGVILLAVWTTLLRFWWSDTTIFITPFTYLVAGVVSTAPSLWVLVNWFRSADPVRTPYWNLKYDRPAGWSAYGILLAVLVGNLYFWPTRGILEVLSEHVSFSRTHQLATVDAVRPVQAVRAVCSVRMHLIGSYEGSICAKTKRSRMVIDPAQVAPGDVVQLDVANTAFTGYVLKVTVTAHGI